MKQKTLWGALGGFLVLFVLVVLLANISPRMAQAQADQTSVFPSGSGATATIREIWRPIYFYVDQTTGIFTGGNHVLNSGPEIIIAFQSPSQAAIVESIRLMIATSGVSGSDSGTWSMTFEIRDYSGQVLHTVSASSIDLFTAARDQWIFAPLVKKHANRTVSPLEYLAIHITPTGTVGTMSIRPLIEAAVKTK